jgi:hypothetical protein
LPENGGATTLTPVKFPLVLLTFGLPCMAPAADSPPAGRTGQIQHLIEESDALDGVPFPEVIQGVSGRRVLPVVATNAADAALLDRLGVALDAVLAEMNAPGSPAHAEARINEVSAHFERALKERLNATPGFACDWPRTMGGAVLRSGYPDLRLFDQTGKRVVYLDPKLFEARSRSSTLRTFYFTPKRETNKVTEDAHHLLIGFSHAGRVEGRWRFTGWELVDLSRFKVRLKAEFQASNRDLYRDDTVVRRSKKE